MILDQIVEDKSIRLEEQKRKVSLSDMRTQAEEKMKEMSQSQPADSREHIFYKNLSKPGISIIGEFKKASPSAGDITSKIDLESRIEDYNASVDAISCLTEEDHFKGNVDYLKQIRIKSTLPILRKDFMIDEYQFYEAKAIEADAVLLICAILDDWKLKSFYQLAAELQLDALVECHDEHEVERALRMGAQIVGINNRNLNDFKVSLETTKRLKKYIPKDKVVVAESGIKTDEDIKYLKELNVDAFLIGQALMEADSPRELAGRWKAL